MAIRAGVVRMWNPSRGPAAAAADFVDKTTELKKAGTMLTQALSRRKAAKGHARHLARWRRGRNAPRPRTQRLGFWVKDGASKIRVQKAGTINLMVTI